MVGRTIAHYRILEKLGEGGMGVVYKARDTHLDRFVAIKVLPPERVADPERKRRFVQEAKTASALNHPNIITVHDISQADGVTFIAMECVEGKTLDQLIGRKGLKLNDALRYAIQIAGALAKAHAAGIVHRDLKPSNIMVTGDGLVKVLDFGLAKLTEPLGGELAETQTLRAHTQEGRIVGTLAYMSPEQAEAKPIDARSDIFSFGSVLYEMLTGRRAFSGDSKMSTLAAIIEREPPPLGQEIPHDLEKLIAHCLRKDPSRRFQHMDDVCSLLEELKEESDSGKLVPARPPRQRRRRRLAWAGAIAVVLIGAGLALWSLRPDAEKRPAAWKETPLTSYPGSEHGPTFSPDGNQVAFTWDGPGQDNLDIYVKLIGVEKPLRLTSDPAPDVNPVWSPDGRFIAFLRPQPGGVKRSILFVPAIGGPEQKLTEVRASSPLAWSPDGNWLAFTEKDSDNPSDQTSSVSAFSIETGERRRLTSAPPGLRDAPGAFSLDGRSLVFSRVRNWSGELYLLALSGDLSPKGQPEQLTFQGRSPFSSAWTPDGREIVYVSVSTASRVIWRVALSGSRTPRRLEFGGDQVGSLAISRQGNRLAYERFVSDRNIWRVEINGPGGKPGRPTKLIASTWADTVPQYSPDGRRVAFGSERSGHNEVWVCRSDGSEPIQLTFLRGQNIGPPRWSPDGKRIVFCANATGNFEIYMMGADGGRPRRLTNHPADNSLASFSRDGRWVYFTSSRTGRFEMWKMPAEGGEPVQITKNGGWVGFESPNGKHLYYAPTTSVSSLWRVPLGGGSAEKITEPVLGSSITLSARGIYFARPQPGGGNAIAFLNFSTGKTTTIATTEHPIFWSMSVSPDERYLLYSQFDQTGSDLMLVENFR